MAEGNKTDATQDSRSRAVAFPTKIKFVIIGLLVGLILGVGGTIFLQNYNPPDKTSQAVAVSVVFDRIHSQNEMISASQRYNITEKVGNSNKIPFTDISIPFTENSFWYRYVGNIKVGVNLQNADFSQDGKVIKVTLDSPVISSNTPNMEESGVLEENNNILNPIHIQDVDAFQESCVKTSETKAIEGGIIEEAKANAETNIRDMFNAALGKDYTIEFCWRG